jgi:hypothetical protein
MKEVQYFYGPDAYGSPPGVFRADNANHARQRKLVSPAFSDKALRGQEQLLKGYVETLVEQLKRIATSRDGRPTDLVKWYNFTTFDIMVGASIPQQGLFWITDFCILFLRRTWPLVRAWTSYPVPCTAHGSRLPFRI